MRHGAGVSESERYPDVRPHPVVDVRIHFFYGHKITNSHPLTDIGIDDATLFIIGRSGESWMYVFVRMHLS